MKTETVSKSKKTALPTDLSTRDTLIEAYLTLCSRLGAGNVTLEKIAKESGFSFGTVRYHFASDNLDITQSTIVYVLEKATKYLQHHLSLSKERPGYDPIEAYLEINFNWIHTHGSHARFLLYYYYLCSTQVSLVAANQVFLKATRARIDDLLIEGIGRGIYPRGRGIQGLAAQVHSVVMGACLASMIEGATGPGNLHEKNARATLQIVVRQQLAEN